MSWPSPPSARGCRPTCRRRPPLLPTPGFDPAACAADLMRRFGNPAIGHLCPQIAADGSQKLPPRILSDPLVEPLSLAAKSAAPVASLAQVLGGQDC